QEHGMAVPSRKVTPLAPEKRPLKLVPKGRPTGSDIITESLNETLESVAQKPGITVGDLVLHDFGTRHPRENNWHLSEYVCCDLTLRDRQKWRFPFTAQPGLMYVPKRKYQGRLGRGVVQAFGRNDQEHLPSEEPFDRAPDWRERSSPLHRSVVCWR